MREPSLIAPGRDCVKTVMLADPHQRVFAEIRRAVLWRPDIDHILRGAVISNYARFKEVGSARLPRTVALGYRLNMSWLKDDVSEVGRVVRVLIKHTIYVAVAALCMRVLEGLIELLFAREKAFDLVPMGWPFLAGDLGMAARFYYLAAREIQIILKGPGADAHPRT